MKRYPFVQSLILAGCLCSQGAVAAADNPMPHPTAPRVLAQPRQAPLTTPAPKTIPIPRQWAGGTRLIPTQWNAHNILVPAGERVRPAAGAQHGKQSRMLVATAATTVVTMKNNRQTVTVKAGRQVELDLQRDLAWKAESGDMAVLKPLTETGKPRFRAMKPGSATIKAYGRMIPKPGQMTAMFVLDFEVTVQVVW